MGQDQYPRTTIAAVDILANHKTIQQEGEQPRDKGTVERSQFSCQAERETNGNEFHAERQADIAVAM